MGYTLGIDPGIASVGWGLIDTDNNTIIDAGVRLFKEADKELNEGRRTFRSGRRLKRRRVNRKRDLIKFLNENNLYCENISKSLNPYLCRKKGLNEELTKEELDCALFNICKHRGSSLEVVEDEKTEDGKGTKAELAKNDALINSGKYVCEIQLERLANDGSIRGIKNNFRTSDYEKELKQILSNQSIDDDVTKQIIDIIIRRRSFDEGPGSFISQTPYGRTYNDDGSVKEGMIDKMRGTCSIFPNEKRTAKLSPSAELFNLLNDINNLRVNDEPIDIETKQEIIKQCLAKGSITPKAIAKILNTSLEDIGGFRIDKSEKPLVSELKGYKTFKKVFEKNDKPELINDFELMDKVANILTNTKIISARKEEISKLIKEEQIVDELSNLNQFVSYHSLSIKAIKLLNEELYNTQLNQMQILSISNKFEFNNKANNQKGKKAISPIHNPILSPVALRTYRQTLKVINAVREKYGELDCVIVESTRDRNSDEQKKRIRESQKYKEDQNKKVKTILDGYPDVHPTDKLNKKILLYLEQNCKTGYRFEDINLDLLVKDPTAYEIDHIIPLSISLDDSMNNKTLVSREENQEKGQCSPLMALERGVLKGSKEKYLNCIKALYLNHSISKKKYMNYTYAKDITRYENMKDFISRNLVDTSYSSRLIHNTLLNYYKDNEVNTKVYTVKGTSTNRFRKYLKLEKDREKDYSHHAIDALLIASIRKMKLYDNLFKDFSVTGKDVVYNKKTGEIVEDIDDYAITEEYIKFVKQIGNYKVTKYSHMIDTKPNRGVSDQTIYSTRSVNGNDMLTKKCADIYDQKFYELANDVANNTYQDKYLMAKIDPRTMSSIIEVINYYFNMFKNDNDKISYEKNAYSFKFNPLYEHYITTGQYIRKYSKHGDGPIVKSMRCIGNTLGSHIDITKNYPGSRNKVVLQSISPYRTDFYYDGDRYKFVTIKYCDIKYRNELNSFVIDEEQYNKKLKDKHISSDATFMFSMHRNEILKISEGEDNTNIYRFVGTNSEAANIIECKLLDRESEKRIKKTIGKKINKMSKLSCDVLGNLYEIDSSKLKLQFK